MTAAPAFNERNGVNQQALCARSALPLLDLRNGFPHIAVGNGRKGLELGGVRKDDGRQAAPVHGAVGQQNRGAKVRRNFGGTGGSGLVNAVSHLVGVHMDNAVFFKQLRHRALAGAAFACDSESKHGNSSSAAKGAAANPCKARK